MNINEQYTILTDVPVNYNWQPQSITNDKIRLMSNINSNWKYREYIQKNANEIMKYNTMEAIYSSGNNPYTVTNKSKAESSPYLFNSIYDNNKPLYGYSNSDLKNDYLKKEQMKSRMISPYISVDGF